MKQKDELKNALEGLMQAIAKREDCLSHLSKIEALAKASEWDPRLAHFLQKRSYEKALSYLKDEEIARGSCGK